MRPVKLKSWKRAMQRRGTRDRRGITGMLCFFLCLALLFLSGKAGFRLEMGEKWEREAALFLWKSWYGASLFEEEEEEFSGWLARFILKQVPYYRNMEKKTERRLSGETDPSYRGYLESAALLKEYECLVRDLEGSLLLADEGCQTWEEPAEASDTGAESRTGEPAGSDSGMQADFGKKEIARAAGGTVAGRELFGDNGSIEYLSEQLADYDFLMKHFYTVHPTAAAGRELMRARDFLEQDFSLEQKTEEDAESAGPQILIYHTHSQEEFADYSQGNREATIVGVGTYLTELLEQKGYRVYHDTAVYDLRDGKLDRSRAYSYALEGVTAILQKYPSIQVVLDIHRDGVRESTHLVTEVNGKKTASIMFFNGTSETPDGPIEYLKNPYRTENLAFSFQMKLCADACYPGFTRRIYLKGLRYNLHLRPRSALIEVGAQNNTYEEARNAMEPLSELLDMVLRGSS